MTRPISRGVLTIIAVVVVLGLLCYAAGYYILQRARTFALGEQCEIVTPSGTLRLDIEQAKISATIAAVAERRRLPLRAVEIAYITAIQESKLSNIPYGDRDSVGVFQQRPSQGWGTAEQLLDPVYATNKFFAALVKVDGYLDLPMHEAAQAVQRSADGSLYAQHTAQAKVLAEAFTGRVPKAVHCWFPPSEEPTPPRTQEARRELVRALGKTAAEGNEISAPSPRRGWLIAIWSVVHAQEYGLRQVRFDGAVWQAERGHEGWAEDGKAPARRVILA